MVGVPELMAGTLARVRFPHLLARRCPTLGVVSDDQGDATDHLAAWYDQDTLARIDATLAAYDEHEAEGPDQPLGLTRQTTAGLAIAVAALTGVKEATEPGSKEIFEEIDPAIDTDADQFVSIYFVPNDPRASRAIVRPWLAPSVLGSDNT